MKRVVVVVLALVFCANVAWAKPPRGRTAAPAAGQKKEQPAKKAQPDEACKAYIVVEGSTGKVLEGQNIHEKRPPASITKMMLAYIVMEKINKGEVKLTDKIAASKTASKIGGSQCYLKEGEEFTLEELMKAVMIHSANDAAHAISEFAAGKDGTDFVDLMNEKAKLLKMSDTEYHSVHGLPPGKDQKEDLTSCSDLAILARELIKYPKLLEWTSTKKDTFRDGKFELSNTNHLLARIPEVDGLKTGYYGAAGFNMVATAKKGDVRFIVVVMGSPSAKIRDNLIADYLKKCFSEYNCAPLTKKGDQVDKDVTLADGRLRKIRGVVARDFSFPVLKARKNDIKRLISLPATLKGEVRQGQKLGEMTFQLDNEVLGKVDIVSPTAVPKANFFTRMVRKVGLDI